MNPIISIIIRRIHNPHGQLHIRGDEDKGPMMVGLDPVLMLMKGLRYDGIRKMLESQVHMMKTKMTYIKPKRVLKSHD